MNSFFKPLISVILSALFLFPQTGFSIEIVPSEFCPGFVENIDDQCDKLGNEQCQQALEKCEKFYQQKSDLFQAEIGKIQAKEKTLQNEIWRLDSQIKNLNYKINKNNLLIKDLGFQISDTEYSITETVSEIDNVKQKLAILLQLRYENDQRSYLEIFLTEQTLSDFFDDLIAIDLLNKETQNLLADIRGLKSSLEEQKGLMVSEKGDLESTQVLVRLQKEEDQELQSEKQDILQKTRGEEALFQKYLQETEAKAQEIRKKIFELAQVGEADAPTLEEAYALAKEVEKMTGIRPAFLLGLIKVESDIGNNVGQCNCAGKAYCRHPDIHWKEIMTQRHWPYFEQITKELGLDPNTTPLSCAVNGGKVQWGGAMGPAQFMPETWIKYGYKEQVEKITGIRPANPWRVKDAFLASGLYLANFGAASQTELAEIAAARAYLCGTTQLTYTCRIAGGQNYTYAIMKYAGQFQDYVDKGILK